MKPQMKPQINFQIGTPPRSKGRRLIVGICLGFLVGFLKKILKVGDEQIWRVIDEIGLKFHIRDINELVLENSELLNIRIKDEVDDAIRHITAEIGEDPPPIRSIFRETEEGETPLGGPMSISTDLNEDE